LRTREKRGKTVRGEKKRPESRDDLGPGEKDKKKGRKTMSLKKNADPLVIDRPKGGIAPARLVEKGKGKGGEGRDVREGIARLALIERVRLNAG